MDLKTFYASLPGVAEVLSGAATIEEALSRQLLPTRAHSRHFRRTVDGTIRRRAQSQSGLTADDLLLCLYGYFFLAGARTRDSVLIVGKPSSFVKDYLEFLSIDFGVDLRMEESPDRIGDMSSATILFVIDRSVLEETLASCRSNARHPRAVYHVCIAGQMDVPPRIPSARIIAQLRAECIVELSGRLSPERCYFSASVSWSD